MADEFKYEKRYYYPHMKPNDVAIWERFIDLNPTRFDTCQYDVQVGSPPPFNPIVNEATQGSADALYRLKIDVVAKKDGQIYIIELKEKAGASAVGQVKHYLDLYVRDEKPSNTPKAIIITNSVRQDLVEFAQKEGVELIVV